MQCLELTAGKYEVINPQPIEYTNCIYILASPSELTINAHALTVSQGTEIAVAIAILWAVAYTFRVISFILQSNDGVKNE